jgi:hypothetical protein
MRRGKRMEISGECDQWERQTDLESNRAAGSAVADAKRKKDGDKWRV